MEVMREVNVIRKNRIYFLRQLMVCSGVWSTSFMLGLFMGSPTVFMPQLRREAAEYLDEDMESWLYSVHGLATIPCLFIITAVTNLYGYRISYILGHIGLLLAYLIFYFSTSPVHLIISEIVFGFGQASPLTIGDIIVTEYTETELRGLLSTINSASFVCGLWCTNTIGTYFHWKNIAHPAFLCSVYALTTIFWPESPQWLASKARFDECRESFYWLQGHSEKSKKELEALIVSRRKPKRITKLSYDRCVTSNAIKNIKSKEFYAPLLLSVLLVTQIHFIGKMTFNMYIIDIIKKMTGSESVAYTGMLILDGVTLFSMYVGCLLSRFIRRRTLYFTSTFTGVAFLFIISLYLYLIKLTIVEESKVWSIVLLTCYSMAMSCGPMVLYTAIHAELIPLKFKNVIILIATLLFYIYSTTLLKVTPYLFTTLDIHGFFLFFGISAGVCTLILYKYLPETKDKTLQEIEQHFKSCKIPETERLKI